MSDTDRNFARSLNIIKESKPGYKIERASNINWLADGLSSVIDGLDISESNKDFFRYSKKSYTLKELRRLKKSIDRLIEKIKIIGDE